MGRLRAANGHPEPWGVKFWAIGNEMYGSWQLGHMPLSEYVKKHTQYAVAMKAMDPSIKVVAVGAVGRWSETMLAEASNHMDLISEHFYVGHKPGLLSHVSQMPTEVRRIADAHRKYRAAIPTLKMKEVPVALDEWNYWYGPDVYGEIGTQYFLEDALGVAAAFNEYARQSDIYVMANYAQTVNVIGAIKTSKTAAVLDTTGRHPGPLPASVRDDPGHGRRRARAARRHGLLEGRDEKRPDVVDRQSDEDAPDDQARRREAAAAEDGQALPRRGRRPPGLQRPRPAAGRRRPRNRVRPVRQEDHRPPSAYRFIRSGHGIRTFHSLTAIWRAEAQTDVFDSKNAILEKTNMLCATSFSFLPQK